MNKNDFESELKDLMSSMSEEEIKKTINALSACKSAVYRKNNQEKSEKARLFSTTERHEAELHYIREREKEGTLKAIGASLLTTHDYGLLSNKLPECNESWWLRDKTLVSNNLRFGYYSNNTLGRIRPVLIIEEIDGDLKVGEAFYINDEKFKLVTSFIAIRISCLEDLCTFNVINYECSILKYCVDGWYMKLIKENTKQKREIPG